MKTNTTHYVKWIYCILLLGSQYLSAQVNYNANTAQPPVYDGNFRYGVNLGYFPGWTTEQLGVLAAGDAALGVPGIGINSARPSLYEEALDYYGYSFMVPTFENMYQRGIRNMNCIVGGPKYVHRDPNYYSGCNKQSEMFAGLYEPIWDGGANGTPYNDNNYYAAYLYKTVSTYKKYVKVWEIWNEPDFDWTFTQWKYAFVPGFGWWSADPTPCDYQLRAPIEHYVRTLRISYDIIKTVDPNAYVSIGALGYPHFLDAVMRNTDNPAGGTVTTDYPLKGGAYFDVMGYHTYPHIDGSLWTYNVNTDAITAFRRHSDASIDSGYLKKQTEFYDVLKNYGYNGTTYPKKIWSVTEFNLPRKAFSSNYVGSDEIQRNALVKAVVASYQNNIMEMHAYKMADDENFGDADYEFDLMGMYKKLVGVTPYNNVQVNPVGTAYRTASSQLQGTLYDAARTASMNLPAGVRGGAFKRADGKYTYVLWAKTTTDLSEAANATYSFPSNIVVNSLERREWDYTQSNVSTPTGASGISLNGSPTYFVEQGTSSGGGNGVDLEATLTSNNTTLNIYQNITFTITVKNKGTATANNVSLAAKMTDSQLAFTSQTLTKGSYSNWTGTWNVGSLAPNETATLNVVAFVLNTNPLSRFVQVSTAAPADVDSTPGNDTNQTANEDDEAKLNLPNTGSNPCATDATPPTISNCPANVTVSAGTASNAVVSWVAPTASDNCGTPTLNANYTSGASFALGNTTVVYTATDSKGNTSTCSFKITVTQGSGGGGGGNGMDLELTMTSNVASVPAYSNVIYTIKVVNKGTVGATNASVKLNIPSGFPYTSHQATKGAYVNWTGVWNVGTLAPMESATLTLTMFTLSANKISVFGQVQTASPLDIDSTSGNDSNQTANEDDEALVVLNPNAPGLIVETTQFVNVVAQNVYPVPANNWLTMELHSLIDSDIQLLITDMTGKTVTSQNGHLNKGANDIYWDITNLNSGVYYIITVDKTLQFKPIRFIKL